MSNSSCYAVDANVILRYLLDDDPKLSPKAREIFQALDDGHITLHCDPITLAEVVWVLSSFYELPAQEIRDGLHPILLSPNFVMPNKERYVLALELFATDLKHFGDACACAAALTDCQGNLLSFDRKLSSVTGVRRSERP